MRAALTMLALVAGQDVEPAQGSNGTDGRWRIARKVAPDRVISQVDPDARHTHKSPEARRDGYRAHVAAEPETGIITDEALTKAAGTENSDPGVAQKFLAADIGDADGAKDAAQHHDGNQDDMGDAGGTREWYGDSAYGTGDLRGAIDDAGHQAVIKPKPLQAPVEGGFTVDDFTVDDQAGTVGCPAGHTRPLSQTRVASFGALCRDCPLRQRCTKSDTGRKIVLHQRDDMLRAARRDWAADPELREKYRKYSEVDWGTVKVSGDTARGHLHRARPVREPLRDPQPPGRASSRDAYQRTVTEVTVPGSGAVVRQRPDR